VLELYAIPEELKMKQILLLTFMIAATAGAAERTPSEAVRVLNDVSYANDASPYHRLDLYLPGPQHKKPPLFVFIHGGAWRSGDKQDVKNVGQAFASRGIAVAELDYRLTGSPGVMHPDHVQDVAQAIHFLLAGARTNPDRFSFDPTRVVIGGHSAGGHLTGLIAFDGGTGPMSSRLHELGEDVSKFCGFIGIEGVYDLVLFAADSRPQIGAYGPTFVVPAFGADPAGWKAASPEFLGSAGGKHAPWLVVFSRADEVLDEKQATEFGAHLKGIGIKTDLFIFNGHDHNGVIGAIGSDGDVLTGKIASFISKNCK
jgi:acetyl esterase/lipase